MHGALIERYPVALFGKTRDVARNSPEVEAAFAEIEPEDVGFSTTCADHRVTEQAVGYDQNVMAPFVVLVPDYAGALENRLALIYVAQNDFAPLIVLAPFEMNAEQR